MEKLFQVGSNEETLKYQKGKMLKRLGALVMFSSVLPHGDWDPGRRRQMDQVCDWLRQ